MKTMLSLIALLTSTALYAGVEIERVPYGSGVPGLSGNEPAFLVHENNIYFAPQYMPGYPTAAPIWPRVVEVPCKQVQGNLVCENYKWRPEYGRGEYLMFTSKPEQKIIVECPACSDIVIPVPVAPRALEQLEPQPEQQPRTLPPITPGKKIGG